MDIDADSQEALQERIVDYYANTQLFNYTDLAVFVVIVFEHVVTFDREVHFAWGRKPSWARCIFLLNRYLSIMEYLVVLGPLLPTVNTFISATCGQLSLQLRFLDKTDANPSSRSVHRMGSLLWNPYLCDQHPQLVCDLSCCLASSGTCGNQCIAVTPDGCMSGMEFSVITWITIALSLNVVQIVFDFVEVGRYSLILPFLNVFTPVLVSRFFLDLDDLSARDRHLPSNSWSGMGHEGIDSTLHFLDPGGALSIYSSHSEKFAGYHGEGGVNEVKDVDLVLAEQAYRPSRTFMSSATGSDASGEDEIFLAVLGYYQDNQLRLYTASAGFAFLLFEYLITFDRELLYIRDHKRTWAKAMFILNRYLSLLQAATTLFSAVLPVSLFVRISSLRKHIMYTKTTFRGRTVEVLQISLYAVWAVFSALRVYALSNNDRVIVVLVGLLSSAPVITFTYIATTAYYEIDAVPSAPYPEVCTLSYNTTMDLFQKAMLLVNSTQIISDFLYNAQFTAACIIFNLLVPVLVSRFYLNLHDVLKAEDERKAEEMASSLEKTRSFRKSKPLPPIPDDEFNDTKISYLDEVFQYNSRVLGRGRAARA
ncbi:hypothetical protein GSI_13814 [Ganoderma sinense ZZ0214-1]|uniref:DUF6533 domain-containing protein n=1 Tax=Ganoderma sinense ZZ0214-1 TaxID=1077348 RepID=A0A2G8RRD7_9APHY|nr:hypothetical protein GSI_13814 [Ganoderma sinense ZZ0214-1]